MPEPTIADTDAPGAPISGLIDEKDILGPRAEVLAMLPTNAMPALDSVTFTGALALIALLSDC